MARGGAVALLGAAAVGWALVVAAPRLGAAAEHDGRYAGTISCEVLPGQTTQPLETEFSMTIAGGQAWYEREILRPTTSGARIRR